MCRVDPLVRLSADNNGETKCVVFVDSLSGARHALTPYYNSVVGSYPFISAFGAHISLYELDDLIALPCVKAISCSTNVTTCKVNPPVSELSSLGPLYESGAYGENVGVAVIDTGAASHMDLTVPKNRLHFKDFINGRALAYDDNGHGTAVASILCGNGLVGNGKFRGIAPKAELYALKAISNSGEGGAFAILEAMQWIFTNKDKFNIRVVCMSFGADPVLNGVDPLSIGAQALWQSGVTVVASAGNDGPKKSSIKSPGINPYIITVGGAGFTDAGALYIPDFSSRGPAGDFNKPDIVAPAVDIACCDKLKAYTSFSGTSMAAPIVAGAAALLLSKQPSFKPDRVKEILLDGAIKIPFEGFEAGRGLLNIQEIDAL